MFIPNGLEETKSDKEGVQVGLFRCPPNEALASNLVAGLIAEDPGFLADLVRSISLPLGVGGQQVAVGVPVWQPEALTGLDAQCGHGAGVEGSEHPSLFQAPTLLERENKAAGDSSGDAVLDQKPLQRACSLSILLQAPSCRKPAWEQPWRYSALQEASTKFPPTHPSTGTNS